MKPEEQKAFIDELTRTFHTIHKPLPQADALGVWWTMLEPFPMPLVISALSSYLSVKDVPLTPAAVLRYLPKRRDERPEADEAWAIAVRAADERETVVWTTEIAEAWATAQPVFQLDDVVGARMAFKATYGRLIDHARAIGQFPQWVISQGFDAARRVEVTHDAVRNGRLQLNQVRVPELLLAGPDDRMSLNAREQLQQLKLLCQQIVGAGTQAATQKEQAAKEEREQFAEKKRALAEEVRKRGQEGGKL
ncbi:hypothetical protein LJ655_08185 [Paraburkholderia sp. MMS20-SJTN17]|uniref:Replicative helicase inhibitor G39P N-terminal domain-containing protein n=1 Tax=Paraburkholderia translucens TaxID=2886945 RepID=A0ABS8KAS6_9BURK|nr:hypothetical protein [Paraburkholderia sp. MMS20-SJTN17]MCC8401869.1 hypothetical protein [Paraburkholderia sp. MMS20-SJTN17]